MKIESGRPKEAKVSIWSPPPPPAPIQFVDPEGGAERIAELREEAMRTLRAILEEASAVDRASVIGRDLLRVRLVIGSSILGVEQINTGTRDRTLELAMEGPSRHLVSVQFPIDEIPRLDLMPEAGIPGEVASLCETAISALGSRIVDHGSPEHETALASIRRALRIHYARMQDGNAPAQITISVDSRGRPNLTWYDKTISRHPETMRIVRSRTLVTRTGEGGVPAWPLPPFDLVSTTVEGRDASGNPTFGIRLDPISATMKGFAPPKDPIKHARLLRTTDVPLLVPVDL